MNHFKFNEPIKTGVNCGPHNLVLYHQNVTNKESFFKYCYYLNLHYNEDDIHNVLKLPNNSYKELHSEYSAITPIILSECASVKRKRNFISILLSYGFKITDNDRIFANLDVYDSILVKNNILFFLSTNDLLSEIKLYIINILIEIYRIEYDPLYIKKK